MDIINTLKKDYRIVSTTIDSFENGERLAKSIIDSQLAACVQLVPGMTSFYRWKGVVEKSEECVVLIKTVQKNIDALIACFTEQHPYETPQFISTPISEMSRDYYRWFNESLDADAE